MRKIDYIVVHYTATYTEKNPTIAEITAWHKKAGFNTIGYHYYIDRTAKRFSGRPEAQVGAHVRGHNSKSIGVCWAGGLEHQTGGNKGHWNITPAQEAELVKLIKELKTRYPNARVVGHRNLVSTQCPGRSDVEAWWAEKEKATPAPTVGTNWLAALLKAIFGAKK